MKKILNLLQKPQNSYKFLKLNSNISVFQKKNFFFLLFRLLTEESTCLRKFCQIQTLTTWLIYELKKIFLRSKLFFFKWAFINFNFIKKIWTKKNFFVVSQNPTVFHKKKCAKIWNFLNNFFIIFTIKF